MTRISILISLIVALFLALHPATFASTTWYVNGVNGNDHSDCKSSQTPCKTVGHAVSLASAGDTVRVGAATYKENLSITFSITISGSNAATTIISEVWHPASRTGHRVFTSRAEAEITRKQTTMEIAVLQIQHAKLAASTFGLQDLNVLVKGPIPHGSAPNPLVSFLVAIW